MAPPPVPKARRKSEMRIELPRPDFSQFKEPAAPQNDPQGSQPVAQPPPLSREVIEMHSAIKNITVKVGEMARFHADTQRLGLPPGQPVPKPITTALSNELAKFDQYRDVFEANILRSIAILTRELNRQKAARAAADVKQKALIAAESSSGAGGGRRTQMEDITAIPQEISETPDVGKKDDEMDQTQDSAEQDATENQSTSDPAAAARRAPSTGPTAVSLSVLPQIPPEGNNSQTGTQSQDITGGSSRLGRGFPLKPDLSSNTLGQPFPTELGVVENDIDRPSSPVTLAPRTAKPRADDPISALNYPGSSPFNPALPPYSSHTGSAFSSASALPLASVVANAMAGAGGSLPGILSAFSSTNDTGDMANSNTNQREMIAFDDQDPLSQTLNSQQDVIDLTQATPVIESGMSLPLNGTGPEDTIDLTMDSPTVPLSQLVNNNKNIVGSSFGTGEFGLGEENKDEGLQAGGQDALDGLLSSFVGPSQDVLGASDGASSVVAETSTSTMPTDATSMLASLTGTSGPNSQFSGLGMNDSGGLDGLNDLNLSSMAFPNMGGMGGISFGGGPGDGSFGGGMDIDSMSSLYMNNDFDGMKDGVGADASDPLRDLMGDDSGVGGTAGLDFANMDAFLSGMDGSGVPDVIDESTGQDVSK
ncbi:hypothetical protein FRB94_001545 [Tulasnella sp. JGI-2019a]|nr:hypothetical protein FRB94_001545 [Tulasnella sp. JGI-2019a]